MVNNKDLNDVLTTFKELYLANKYDDALNVLLENKEVMHKGLFHYNYGTVLAKKGQLPGARFNLEKALSSGFYSEDLVNNLNYTVQTIGDTHTSMSYLLQIPKVIPTQVFHVFFLGIFSLLLILRFFKKLKLKSIVLAGILPLLLYGFYIFSAQKVSTIITLDEVMIREGPSKIFEEKLSIPAGKKIFAKKIKKNWVKIIYPVEYIGWVKRDKLGFL